MKKNEIFDSHIHFNDEQAYHDKNIASMIEEGKKNRVGAYLCASFSLISSVKAVEFSKKFDNVYAAVAIHPNEVSNHSLSDFNKLNDLIMNSNVKAIGETGIDYFYTKKDMKLQKQFFIEHIKLAIKNNLPLQMHIRDYKDVFDAYDDVIAIIKEYEINNKAVHCFSANAEYAQKFLDLGCYINIGGAVTFKNAKALQDAVKIIPLDKILIETDAPYLTPTPHRGKINYPKYTILIAEKIAELKEINVEEVILQTTKNAMIFLNILN